ncbi:MAG TPA: hypothetical protein VI636_02430 [Candidatus Angelobacter sp.]
MPSNNGNRVLSRMGARELAGNEMQWITGGGHNTRASQVLTGTPGNPDENFDS